MGKIEEIEVKIRSAVQMIATLRKENLRLQTEIDSLKAHLSLYNNENNKAQQMMADYEQMRRKQEVVTQKVEHALAAINAMRGAA